MGTTLDAVVAVDEDGVIVGWNEVVVHTLGWTVREAVGRAMGELIVRGCRPRDETGPKGSIYDQICRERGK